MKDLFFLLAYLLSILIPTLLILRNQNWKLKAHSIIVFFIFQGCYLIPPWIDNTLLLLKWPSINWLILYTTYCNIFLFGGYLFADSISSNFKNKVVNRKSYGLQYSGIFFVLFLLGTLLFNIAFYKQISDLQSLLAPYLSENDAKNNGGNVWEKIRLYAVSIIAGTGLISWVYSSSVTKRVVILICIFEVCLILLLRGYRTALLLCLLPVLIGRKNFDKNFTVNLLLISVLMVIIGQAIDIIRAAGWYGIGGVDFIEPLTKGEFGQTVRGFEKLFAVNYSYLLGESIIVGPIRNIFTTLGFPYEPISTKFAYVASGSGPLFGWGFSPQLEAYWNFSIFGVFYFALLGFMLRNIEKYFRNFGPPGNLLLAIFYPTLVLFQRIDLSVYIKMNILTFMCMGLFIFLLQKEKFDD